MPFNNIKGRGARICFYSASSNSRLIFSNPNLVCKLKKAIYGSICFDWLKQAPRANKGACFSKLKEAQLTLIKGRTGLFFLSQKPIHNQFRCEE